MNLIFIHILIAPVSHDFKMYFLIFEIIDTFIIIDMYLVHHFTDKITLQ